MAQPGLEFLNNIKYYLFGDIETFLRVYKEAEDKEAQRLNARKSDSGTRGWGVKTLSKSSRLRFLLLFRFSPSWTLLDSY